MQIHVGDWTVAISEMDGQSENGCTWCCLLNLFISPARFRGLSHTHIQIQMHGALQQSLNVVTRRNADLADSVAVLANHHLADARRRHEDILIDAHAVVLELGPATT